MNNPFFSIIIPIHNTLPFIKGGISYLINQKFNNFEILIINDGSTDASLELCQKLLEKFTSVSIMEQTNRGAGIARNLGINHAKGKYICFFDIDDKVNPGWLEKIYELLIVENPDVLIYSYNEINPKLKTSTTFKFQDKSYFFNKDIRTDFVKNISGIKFNNGFVWNKVYKRDFLIKYNIKFPDLRIQQDEVFNHEVYKYATSLITSSEILYDYYIYDKGNTRNTFIPDRLKIFEKVKHSFFSLSEHWQLENADLEYYIHSRLVRNALYNRNPKSAESRSSLTRNLFQSDSLNESARFMLEKSKILPFIERLYLISIIKKSKSLFSLAEIASQSISIGKHVSRRLFR